MVKVKLGKKRPLKRGLLLGPTLQSQGAAQKEVFWLTSKES
jgi:hypothetical protein